jgi:hypothetical protein
MPTPPERRRLRILGGYLLFVGILSLAAAPLYYHVEPSTRPLVVRLGAGLILGVALVHLVRIVRGRIAAQPLSAFERALDRPPGEPRFAPLFLKLRDEVRFSAKSQAYFEHVLWPRLLDLVVRRPWLAPATNPARPAGRCWLRRGPSLATLRNLVARIEEHS